MEKRTGRIQFAGLVLALAMMGGAPAEAQQGAPVAERTIRVTGIGETQVQPDQAEILFAVETTGTTAQLAARENAQLMDRVIAALVAAGVPRTDIETRGYTLFPDYAHDEGRTEPRIRGYRASNRVVLRTVNLENVGALIDTALGAGANRMDGISFQLQDTAPAQAAALRSAVESARASAETIASALGVQLGQILDANTTTDPIRPVMMAADRAVRMEAAAAPPTPIQPGEQTVRAQITLVYAIVGG